MMMAIETKGEILLRIIRCVVLNLADDGEAIVVCWHVLVLFVAEGILGAITLVHCFTHIVHHPHVKKIDTSINLSF